MSRPGHDCIYVMGYTGLPGGPHKIGTTQYPERRTRQVAYKMKKNVVMVEHFPTGRIIDALYAERYAHWLLKDHYIGGEWFDVSSDEAIEAARSAAKADLTELGLMPPLRGAWGLPAVHPSWGLRDRIDAALEGESYASFVREAVERELERRAETKRKPKAKL